MSRDGALLRVNQVATGYGKKQILFGVSLEVNPGEIVAVIGPNGAGKSTLIKAVMGYLRLWEGQILYRGRDLSRLPPYQRVAQGIAYAPQGRAIFPSLTVQEHLDLGGWLLRSRREKKEAQERVFALFPSLAERRRQKAGTMSGGERQMLSLARALMLNPSLLLLDEPSLGLAPRIVELVFQKVQEINALGVAIFLVEQNAATALRHAHRGYVLEGGKNRFQGRGNDLLHDPEVRRLYLGGGESPEGETDHP